MSDAHSPGPWWVTVVDPCCVLGGPRTAPVLVATCEVPSDAALIAAAPETKARHDEMAALLREFNVQWEKFVRENDDGAGSGVLQEDPFAVKVRALLARLPPGPLPRCSTCGELITGPNRHGPGIPWSRDGEPAWCQECGRDSRDYGPEPPGPVKP